MISFTASVTATAAMTFAFMETGSDTCWGAATAFFISCIVSLIDMAARADAADAAATASKTKADDEESD